MLRSVVITYKNEIRPMLHTNAVRIRYYTIEEFNVDKKLRVYSLI